MRAITADIYTHEISAIADAESFGELPANLTLITEEQWEADPIPGQLWQGNIPATFYPSPIDVLANRKDTRKAEVADKLASVFDGGFTVPSGTLAGSVLQVRTQEDRANWLTSQASYSTMVAMGQGATVAARFRDSNNVTHTVSYQEGLTVLLKMAAWGAAVMARSWTLKDEIAAAGDLATLDAIDVEAGWP